MNPGCGSVLVWALILPVGGLVDAGLRLAYDIPPMSVQTTLLSGYLFLNAWAGMRGRTVTAPWLAISPRASLALAVGIILLDVAFNIAYHRWRGPTGGVVLIAFLLMVTVLPLIGAGLVVWRSMREAGANHHRCRRVE